MSTISKSLFVAATLGVAILPYAAPAQAAGYTALYAFGDSLSDTGNAWLGSGQKTPLSPPYAAGRFSNGPVWVEDVARSLGLAQPTARALGGSNFAVGGASTGAAPRPGGKPAPSDLPGQVTNFGKSVANIAPPDGLYTLTIGANDVKFAVNASPDPAVQRTAALAAADAAAVAMNKLVAMGARHLLVANVPDLGQAPGGGFLSPLGRAALTAAVNIYNARLASGMALLATATGASISLLDVQGTLSGVVAAPQRLGFENVTQSCLSKAAVPVPCAPTRAGQNLYLYWDGGHPTSHGHAVIAAQALTQLP